MIPPHVTCGLEGRDWVVRGPGGSEEFRARSRPTFATTPIVRDEDGEHGGMTRVVDDPGAEAASKAFDALQERVGCREAVAFLDSELDLPRLCPYAAELDSDRCRLHSRRKAK